MLIDKINDIKMKLGSNVTLRKAGKTKLDSEISVKADNSAKRKRVEEAMDMGQGDDRLPGTDRMLTDVAIVPPILMAGLKSASYKTKRKDHSKIQIKIHALIAITYARTELQLRFAWCMTGLTQGENDSEVRKISKGEKIFLMTSMRYLMT